MEASNKNQGLLMGIRKIDMINNITINPVLWNTQADKRCSQAPPNYTQIFQAPSMFTKFWLKCNLYHKNPQIMILLELTTIKK